MSTENTLWQLQERKENFGATREESKVSSISPQKPTSYKPSSRTPDYIGKQKNAADPASKRAAIYIKLPKKEANPEDRILFKSDLTALLELRNKLPVAEIKAESNSVTADQDDPLAATDPPDSFQLNDGPRSRPGGSGK